jgi:hypothetical protein
MGEKGTGAGLARIRRRFHGWLGRHPALYLPLVSRRRAFDGSRKAVGKDTELVIEGFPRSGNSFALAAFRLTQPSLRIAHHLHAPAQVIAAARQGIPALVVIRDPDDAIVSLLLRAPGWEPREAFAEYARFYSSILPYRERFVVASFREIVSDFGPVIRRLNRRFGTSFAEFEHTPENVKRCFEFVEHVSVTNGHGGEGFELSVARPSAVRDEQKSAVRASILERSLDLVRAEARRIYYVHTRGGVPA